MFLLKKCREDLLVLVKKKDWLMNCVEREEVKGKVNWNANASNHVRRQIRFCGFPVFAHWTLNMCTYAYQWPCCPPQFCRKIISTIGQTFGFISPPFFFTIATFFALLFAYNSSLSRLYNEYQTTNWIIFPAQQTLMTLLVVWRTATLFHY